MKFKLLCTLPILIGILILHQAKSQRPKFTENSWTLKPNVVVVDVDGSPVQYPLSCLGSFNIEEEGWRKDNDLVWRRDGEEAEPIIWRKDGLEMKRGNSFLVNLEEWIGGGNFSCHRLDGSLLKETMVLVKRLDKKKRILQDLHETGYMNCSTSKHQNMFQCSWKCSPSRQCIVVSIKVARGLPHVEDVNCTVDDSGQQWTCSSVEGNSDIVCSVDSNGASVSCEDRHYCPYAEERDRITLTMYIRSNFVLEEYSHKFYVSEIVKPDRVSIKKLNSSTIEWSYPVSWNRPSSYYPLAFEVKVISKKQRSLGCMCGASCADVKVNTTDSTQWSVKRKETVCVRAQDALCNSLWSDWEEYRHKKKGSKREKQMKQKNKGVSQ